eukprot:m.281778 g.281778  ORF g.281778 m.281778 type:complete len:355 (+) comp19404_c0_seq20:1498-2562(+)
MRSRAMKISTAPKKNFGVTDRIDTGIMKNARQQTIITMPASRLRTPARIVNSVWEKMYEPVNPPVTPLHRLEIPTVCSSWLKSRGLPSSIFDDAMPSRANQKETSNEDDRTSNTKSKIKKGVPATSLAANAVAHSKSTAHLDSCNVEARAKCNHNVHGNPRRNLLSTSTPVHFCKLEMLPNLPEMRRGSTGSNPSRAEGLTSFVHGRATRSQHNVKASRNGKESHWKHCKMLEFAGHDNKQQAEDKAWDDQHIRLPRRHLLKVGDRSDLKASHQSNAGFKAKEAYVSQVTSDDRHRQVLDEAGKFQLLLDKNSSNTTALLPCRPTHRQHTATTANMHLTIQNTHTHDAGNGSHA